MEPAPILDREFLEKLERLTLRWQKSFAGLVGGHNQSRFAGAGQEFLDHRNFHHAPSTGAPTCASRNSSSRCSRWSPACRCACWWISAIP
jgi:hypothetical protein